MVEGLDGGRWALISKVHHCMVDGVSGTDLLTVVLDPEREPEPPPPGRLAPERRAARRRAGRPARSASVRSALRATALRSALALARAGVAATAVDTARGLLR